MESTKIISALVIMILISLVLGPATSQGSIFEQGVDTHRSHYWGMHLHNKDFQEGSTNILKDLGVQYVRTDIGWKDLEPLINVYDTEYIIKMELIFNDLDKNGLEPIIVFTHAPTWAKALYKIDKTKFWTQVSEYHSKVAELWGSKTKYYQIENELNHPARPTYLDYKDIPDYTKHARTGLAEHDNDFKTILNSNCVAVGWSVDMNGWLASGAKNHINIIGLDIYPLTWDSPATLWSALRQTMALTTKKGTPWYDKDIMVAETGYSTYSKVFNEEVQKSFIEVAIHHLNDMIIDFNQEYSNQVLMVCWYELYDSRDGSMDVEHNFGILKSDNTKKVGYPALKTEINRYEDLTALSSGMNLPLMGFGFLFLIIIVSIILIVTLFYGKYKPKKIK